ncbi:MAG: tail fiber domain-containing protein [Bacteroidia bacterium]
MTIILNINAKNFFFWAKISMFFLGLLETNSTIAQNIGVGTNNPQEKLHTAGNIRTDGSLIINPTTAAAANSISISKSTGTLIISNVSSLQTNAITMTQTPADGQLLYIFNNDDNEASFSGKTIAPNSMVQLIYDGSNWKSASLLTLSSDLEDADGDTKIQLEESNDEDVIRFDLGGTEKWAMNGSRLEPKNTGLSTFIGYEAGLNDDLTNNFNTGIGYQTLKYSSSASFNTAIGISSGLYNTGTFNTFTGGNTGRGASINNATGGANAAYGYASLQSYTTSNYNCAFGYKSLNKTTSGGLNCAFGSMALENNTTGYGNVAIGHETLPNNTTKSYIVALGYRAGYSADASSAIYIGLNAGYNNSGSQNIFMGNSAGYNNGSATQNIAIGYYALSGSSTSFTGNSNTAIGYASMRATTSGNKNTSLGNYTLNSNTTGYENVALGYYALEENSTGYGNIALGSDALQENTTANNNIAIGRNTLNNTKTGSNNVAIGVSAGLNNSSGTGNVFIGSYSGYYETGSGKLHIDNTPTSQPLIYGDFSSNILEINGVLRPGTDNSRNLGESTNRWKAVYATNGTIQTSDVRFKENIEDLNYGLEEIMKLRSVSYNWKNDTTAKNKVGFIAQELEEVVPEVVTIGTDSLKTRGVNYAELVPILVNAIQEQQKIIENLENEQSDSKEIIRTQTAQIEANKTELDVIKNYLQGLTKGE